MKKMMTDTVLLAVLVIKGVVIPGGGSSDGVKVLTELTSAVVMMVPKSP